MGLDEYERQVGFEKKPHPHQQTYCATIMVHPLQNLCEDLVPANDKSMGACLL